MNKMMTICALVALSRVAYAQTTPTTTDPETPAVATPDTTNPTDSVAGENSFTEDQARERLKKKGYSNIADLSEDGIWRARADKSGPAVEVDLDYQGSVTEGGSK